MKFNQLKLERSLERAITELGFTEPTPIQQIAIPPALEGRDLIACAMTGSGKTAAFALPILQRLGQSPKNAGIRALIVTPTRELAIQVHEHLSELGRHTEISSTTVFGGVNANPQIRALRKGVDVVVATPGRLLDHMQQPWFSFRDLEILVLDEADRMLDMGFLPDVRRIIAQLPKKRQTLLFSATMPRPIVELSRNMLQDPVRLNIERPSAPATGVTQTIFPVPEKLKPALLLHMLRSPEIDTALVFTRTKHRANRLAQFLDQAGISCDRIHGSRSQPQRQAALKAFKERKIQVLVATDIAARGIDIAALPHVINFDVPGQAEDYIHRVGRTARAEATGEALTFASPAESKELAAIERAVGRRIEHRKLPDFNYKAQPEGRFEIPIGERIAEIRRRKAEERARRRAKEAARANRGNTAETARPQRRRRPRRASRAS